MRVLGLMSGTSGDGIDVALVRIHGRGWRLRAHLENSCTLPYSPRVRRLLLRLANANRQPILSVAEISEANFLLGELFARAARQACRRFRVRLAAIDLIGSHGHTVHHQPSAGKRTSAQVASTLQLGEPAVIAERTGVPVVANFRARDLAAGGQGAPLVPYVDYLLYRHPRRGRVALNLGGIANLTVIPANASPQKVFAFDTGPGNMVIDAVIEHGTRRRLRYDRSGRLAARGQPLAPLLRRLLRHSYFRQRPPKSTGREQFGQEFAESFLRRAQRSSLSDRVRTATELTVESIRVAFDRFILPRARVHDVILGGGGTRNTFLVERLRQSLPALTFIPAGQLGVEGKAKEAFAFAVLAYQTWHGQPANLPSATGARHPVVLGAIVPGGACLP